ncbi:MAG: hypothetical protein P4L28_07100 [Paludibacteraceae bacterium]|nr:hypothetical protein [Paludibacteraceae bacterium]
MKEALVYDSAKLFKQIVVQPIVQSSSQTIWWMRPELAQIIIPTVITILVFVLTQVLIWRTRKITLKRETKNYKSVIFSAVDFVTGLVENQIKSCRSFAKNLQESEKILPERLGLVNMLADKVDEINIERFINTFMTNTTKSKDNSQHTYSIVAQFNYLKSMEIVIKTQYDLHQKQMYEIMNEWNKNFMLLDKLFVEISKEVGDNSTHDLYPFYQKIKEIRENWITSCPNGGISVNQCVNNLINPLSIFIEETVQSSNSNNFAYSFLEILKELQIINLKWKTNVKGFALVFTEIADDLNKSIDELTQDKDYFTNNTKTKNIFAI